MNTAGGKERLSSLVNKFQKIVIFCLLFVDGSYLGISPTADPLKMKDSWLASPVTQTIIFLNNIS